MCQALKRARARAHTPVVFVPRAPPSFLPSCSHPLPALFSLLPHAATLDLKVLNSMRM
jgi:hypothetical protein